MAAPIDVRAGLAAELKRLVRDAAEWPIRDRRRFRNLLLDAVSSDAMPLAELLLRVHDDGLLRVFPDRSATRAAWDTSTARLASDLQAQRFVEPGIARFVAEAWASALGPELVPVARTATPRPAVAPRAPVRSSANMAPRPTTSPATSAASSAASLKAYRQTNVLFVIMAVTIAVLTLLAFRSTNTQAAPRGTAVKPAQVQLPVPAPVPASVPAPAETVIAAPAASRTSAVATNAPVVVQPDSASPPRDSSASIPRVGRQPVAVSPAPVRTTDDIVLNAGRVFEGRVLSVKQGSITVKDEETGLDFEIPKSDIDRIVTRDGRIMRFGDDNVPLLGDDDDLTAISHSGRYRARYAERWGTERSECSAMARTFAPGTDVIVQHLRGAPMLKLAFLNGQGFNAAVRPDGLFESGADQAPVRGPRGAFVSTRLSGRFSRGGVLQGVVRLSAVMADGTLVCDLALTLRGERQP